MPAHLAHPLQQEYLVLVDKAPTKAQIKGMMAGVIIDGVQVMPEEMEVLESGVKLRVTVAEGKKHEVSMLVWAVPEGLVCCWAEAMHQLHVCVWAEALVLC